MANKKIAGITVEIGGDTTKLSTALKDSDKVARDLKSELKEVDKALKLDPSNVVLLKQKQDILNESIKNSKEKLDKLKEAQEQVTAQFQKGEIDEGQYRAFQREVENTENELKYFKTEAEKAGNAGKNLSKDVSTVKDDFKKAGDSIDKAGQCVSAFGDTISDVGEKATVASALIVGAATASYKAWQETDDGYDTIIKKTGATGEALEDLQNVANKVFTSMPVDMGKVGTAVGEINTRFGATGDELEKLTTAFLKYSEVNDSDVNSSVDNVSGVMKAFNVDASKAGDLLNKITSISQRTGISVSKLESSLLSNADNFKTLGYDVGTAAEMLGQFEINGVESGTALAAMKKTIGAMITEEKNAMKADDERADKLAKAEEEYKKTSDALEVLKQKQTEYTDKTKDSQKLADSKKIEQYEAKLKGLTAEIDSLKNSSEDTTEQITDFGDEFDKYIQQIKEAKTDTEAITIASQIFGNKGAAAMAKSIREGRADFTKFNGTLYDTKDTVNTTFEATLDAPDRLKVAINQVKLEASDLAAIAMERLAPALKRLTDKVKELTEKFNGLSEDQKTVVLKIAGIVTAIGPLLVVIGKLTSGVGGVISSVGKLFTLLATNPSVAVVAGIAAVIAALALLYTKNEEFRNFVDGMAADMKEFFMGMAEDAKKWYEDNKDVINDIIRYCQFLAKILKDYLIKTIQDTWAAFKLAWTIISNTWEIATSFFRTIWENIKEIFSAVDSVLSGDFSGAWESIKKIFENTGQFFEGVWNSIKEIFSGVGTFFQEKFEAAWKFAKNAFNLEEVKEFWKDVADTIVNAFKSLPEAIAKIFTDVYDKVKEIAEKIGDTIDDVTDKIPIVSGAKTVANKVKSKIPFLAGGGTVKNGGMAVVGEAGPELIRMMNGEAVVTPINNNTSSQPAPTATTSGGRTTVHQTFNLYVKEFAKPEDARRTSEQLSKLQKQQDFGKGVISPT